MHLKLKNYAIIMIGTFILAFGVYNIHAQTYLTEGGVLGMILLLNHWFHINPAITSLILDTILFGVGAFILGRDFLKYSLVATFSFSIFYSIVSTWGPQFTYITQSQLLSAIVGALFVGVGAGMVIRLGGSCGGDDTLALLVHKFTGIKISTAYLCADVTILLLSLSYIPLQNIIYSLITVVISSMLIGFIKTYKFKTN